MLQDFRFALRTLTRQRGFAAVAILTIALGVSLTTTTFTVADSILYRSLPYAQPQELYEVFGANRGDLYSRVPGAYADVLAWRDAGVFSSVGMLRNGSSVALSGGSEVHRVVSVPVDDQLLPTLGIPPLIGRGFTPEDCREGARPVAMISSRLWRSDFGSDPGIVGKTIDVDSSPVEVVGVLPPEFLFPVSAISSSALPIELLTPLIVPPAARQDHNARGHRAIGRVAPGLSIADAQVRLDAVQQSLKPLYRPSNVLPGAFDGVRIVPLQAALVGRPTHDAVLFLLIAAFAVLAVASVNMANMLLARGADRERELAVRAAIGASRGRLLRLVLVESITLSVMGGLCGWLLARLTFAVVLTQLPPRLVPLRPPIMDSRVAAFAMLVSVLVGIVFGLIPAIRQSGADFAATVKQAGPSATRRGGWARDALVFAEVTLAVMLVGAGAVVLRSFANVLRVDPGMDTQHVLTLQLTPSARIPRAAVEQRAMFFRNALDVVRGVPGVQAAALTDNLLLAGGFRGSALSLEGIDPGRLYTPGNGVTEVRITADYFRVMGIPLIAGASFPNQMTGDEAIAITSSRVGRIAGLDPLGRELVVIGKDDTGKAPSRRYRVVGVAAEAHDHRIDGDPLSIFYLPFKGQGQSTLAIRADHPAAVAAGVADAIHRLDATAVVDQVRTLDELVARSLAERRFNAFLYGAFSASALLLSAIGVYGVIAYSVSRRTREIGIRIALGAAASRVITFVAARTALVFAAGLIAGVGGLIAVKSGVRALVFNVAPDDPMTFAAAAAILLLAAISAAYLPVRRAVRVDPIVALRAE